MEVTVVVAAYNHAGLLRKALDSVAAQTLEQVALVVTDDASRDGSAEVATAWLAETGRAARTVFHEHNAGICRTFNEALALVRTPFYTVMSADDRMLPDRLAVQVELLRSAGPDAVAAYSDAWLIDEHGRRTGGRFSDSYRFAGRAMPEGPIFGELCHGNWIPAPSVLLRTSAVRDVGGYDESLSFEDYDLWLRLSRRHHFVLAPEPLVEYRVSAGQATAGLSASMTMGVDLTRARVKNLGIDRDADRVILDEAEGKLRHAYLSGVAAATLAPALRTVARHRPTPATLALATASSLRVPGHLLGRRRTRGAR
ncbi:glycosyltransferase family A protein [Nocardioides bigeumensis]|uniref:Glycosyltransferase family A protein n=1 Tax=Nocardioides bigeumensis TaxID=433657 RepID=A0ABP5K4L0_9ACTN